MKKEPHQASKKKHGLVKGLAVWLSKKDLVLLVSMLGIVAGTWGFIELADEVREGATARFDERLLRALREPGDLADPIGPKWLEETMRDVTAMGSATLLCFLTVVVGGFLVLRRQHHALGLLLGAIVGGLLLNLALKTFFARPRPEFVPHLMRATSASFPSGHSMLSAVGYLTLGSLLARLVEGPRLKLYILGVVLFIAFAVGVSRVYLGVHYPTDVLAGWLVGLMWSVGCWLAARYLQQRGAVEKEK